MQIGNVNLNLDHYTGQDFYSDGSIEDEILSMVKNNNDIHNILATDNRWPLLYHLSPVRRNLLEWMDFSKGSSVLEIGAGCGALTGLLCEKAKHVTAVELSKRRATIIAERHKEHNNLDVIVGNWNDIRFNKQFDYITLIGVLEYASQFTKDEQPFNKFLSEIKNTLKPGGSLIIAIENKFGLKYWSGAREDHTSKFFDGLENYPNTNKVRTFGKPEFESLLMDCGYKDLEFHYPYPDYKLPQQIFSDKFLPKVGFSQGTPNYDMDRIRIFNEGLVLDNLIGNEAFPFFSNSFLVICKKNKGA